MNTYLVAGRRVQTDQASRFLSPFEIPSSSSLTSVQLGADSHLQAKLIYSGPGTVAGSEHQVACKLSDQGYRLEIAGVGVFWVAPDGRSFWGDETATRVDSDHLSHTALGPPLVLALALQGVFCFHASAVVKEGSALAFLGSSGVGKSTLAEHLANGPHLGLRRLADDALAVEGSSDRPHVLTRFPQLKLSERDQPWLHHPDKMKLAALYLLERPAGNPNAVADVELYRLSPRDAVLSLMRHTVAARLFCPTLVERLLDFCEKSADQIPVYRLVYPWRPEAVADISRTLLAEGQF